MGLIFLAEFLDLFQLLNSIFFEPNIFLVVYKTLHTYSG